jgi:hypothetical protein
MDPHSISKLDPDSHSLKKLDPDEHQVDADADPKHCFKAAKESPNLLPRFVILPLFLMA